MATVKKAAPAKAPARKAAASKRAATMVKTAASPAAQPAAKPAPPPAAAAPAPKVVAPKPAKAKKSKQVRDSFTIPKAEYAVLADLKQRALMAGVQAKKSEVLRAGIKALAAMSNVAFLAALGAVPAIKTGRPAKD